MYTCTSENWNLQNNIETIINDHDENNKHKKEEE